MTDQATSLSQAIDGVQEPETPAVEPETTEAPQEAEQATTTPSEPAPEPEPKAEPPAEKPDMVPVAVVQELRRELRELKQAAQPKQQVPDFIDPEGMQFVGQRMAEMQANHAAELSEVKARMQFGSDKVDAAFKAAESAGILDNFKGIADPWGSLTRWHQQQTVLQEVGDDPAAYKSKLEAEIRAKVEAEMVAKQAAKVAGTPAPSLANVTGTGGGARTTWNGPTPLDRVIPE